MLAVTTTIRRHDILLSYCRDHLVVPLSIEIFTVSNEDSKVRFAACCRLLLRIEMSRKRATTIQGLNERKLAISWLCNDRCKLIA